MKLRARIPSRNDAPTADSTGTLPVDSQLNAYAQFLAQLRRKLSIFSSPPAEVVVYP